MAKLTASQYPAMGKEGAAMPRTEIRSTVCSEFAVDLSWGDHEIQLATVVSPRTSDEPQTLEELIADWNPAGRAHARGLYVTLEWDQVNQLIRDLRRARDRRFGAA